MFKSFAKNENGRDFVVGDVHGMFQLLNELQEKVCFDYEVDRLFCVGDLVDRGPSSQHVADWLKEPWFHSIRGNHEQLVMEAYEAMNTGDHIAQSDALGTHMINGGSWFYELDGDRQRDIIAQLIRLPYAIEIETDNGSVGLVHAEVPDDDWLSFKMALQNPPINYEHFEHYALWSRGIVKDKAGKYFKGVKNIDLVIVGHTPVQIVTPIHNVMYLDTGACFGRKLSMVCIQGKDDGILFEIESNFKLSR